jgi:CRP/FNR family cyclic AMP-dependent transcriptional regulator
VTTEFQREGKLIMAHERGNSVRYLKYDDNFKSYKTGEVIFRENDPGMFLYVVKSGKVELRREGLLLEVVEPGQIFGEMALIEHNTRSATATAQCDCQVVPVDETKFAFMVSKTPYFALDVLRIMAHRLRHATNEMVISSGIHPVEKS